MCKCASAHFVNFTHTPSLIKFEGILIWQDFMFACAVYPTNGDYLTNVHSEIVYQLDRLRHHACIMVWAGNNENEALIATNWYGTDSDKTLYTDDYRQLYVNTIREIVTNGDASRPFLTSSPTNGLQTQKENWVASNPWALFYL